MITSSGKISTEAINRIEQLVAQGNYDFVASTAIGIHPSTFYRWKKRGDAILESLAEHNDVSLDTLNDLISDLPEEDKLYSRFALRVKKAEAEAEIADVAKINEGKADWLPHKAKLAAKYPRRWGERKDDTDYINNGLAFLGRLAEALKRPQVETTVTVEKPLELT